MVSGCGSRTDFAVPQIIKLLLFCVRCNIILEELPSVNPTNQTIIMKTEVSPVVAEGINVKLHYFLSSYNKMGNRIQRIEDR